MKEEKKTRVLDSVRLLEDARFFGINSAQVARSMAGIHLEWNGDVVVVTHDSYPGQSKWVFPANISTISWVDE